MEETLISFKTAQLAKEKGFDISNETLYTEQGEVLYSHITESFYGVSKIETKSDYYVNDKFPYIVETDSKTKFCVVCYAPTQALLQKWLREKHNIHIQIDWEDWGCWEAFIVLNNFFRSGIENNGKQTYEEALEAGLYEALTLIK